MMEMAIRTGANPFERLMGMDEAAWSRHANPWSVYTRMLLGLPVTLGALWSIRPLGLWSLAPLAAAFLLARVNPVLFPPPASTDNWASKATFGERVWLNRANLAIPSHHARWAMGLAVASGVAFVAAALGAALHHPLAAIAGGVVCWQTKAWFCDRMVWLYEDMKTADPAYAAWLR